MYDKKLGDLLFGPLYRVNQKSKPRKLLFISSPNINRFLKFFRCLTQQEICNKAVITDLTTHKKCHYTTLQNISFQKLHGPKTVMADQESSCSHAVFAFNESTKYFVNKLHNFVDASKTLDSRVLHDVKFYAENVPVSLMLLLMNWYRHWQRSLC